jgi:hypothetical protein
MIPEKYFLPLENANALLEIIPGVPQKFLHMLGAKL